MKRAKITAPKTIGWSEMCFCLTPLKHEQESVYDYFLTNFETQIIDDYVENNGENNGESFFVFLEINLKNSFDNWNLQLSEKSKL